MPKLLRSSETVGCGATIKLDSGEVVYISIAQVGVLVRHWDMSGGFLKTLISNFFGAKLYKESDVYKNAQTAQALAIMFPDQAAELDFKNPVLAVFSNAIWHCSSAAEVCTVLNGAAAKLPEQERSVVAFKNQSHGTFGATPDSAIIIHATDSLDGIPEEYAKLRSLFGIQNRDWKLINRSIIQTDRDRKLERFVISVSDKPREVYFDITGWLTGNTSGQAKARLETLISKQDNSLTVLLPKEEFMTLQGGLLRLTGTQLAQLGLSLTDRKIMLDPFLDTLKQWHGMEYPKIPEHLSVTTMISVWSKIMSLLACWEPADLLQEEELENLKAIIGGTIKAARSTPKL